MSRLSPAEDAFRATALAFIARLETTTGGAMTYEQVCEFRFEGRQVHLMTAPGLRGIMKPKGLETAISIRTPFVDDVSKAPYADEIGEDFYPRYKWQGNDPDQWDNAAVRRAYEFGVPVIWFRGVAPSLYSASPVYVVGEERDLQQFVLALDEISRDLWNQELFAPPDRARRREYAWRQVKVRLHQPAFSRVVLRAYDYACALCNLQHVELLDAAHIRADADGGEPVVSNGIAMCAIHHRAFDSNIIGVRADGLVQVRAAVLREKDGPTLRYALQGIHGTAMRQPSNPLERPHVPLLEERFEKFLNAS